VDVDLALLCRSCGLCCDGSLFGRADLTEEEVSRARRHLDVLPSGKGFSLPCAALSPDRSCSIYEDRPQSCRGFTCRLYERHRREGGSLDARLASVSRVRHLLSLDALGEDEFAELRRVLEEDFAAERPARSLGPNSRDP
jgi:Fe-S-cluster containining protein